MNWLIVAVISNIAANLLLKQTMVKTTIGGGDWRSILATAGTSPVFFGGMFCLILLLGSYLMALRSVPVAIAYPVTTGLAAAGLVLGQYFFLNDPMSPSRLFGVLLVVTGSVVLAR